MHMHRELSGDAKYPRSLGRPPPLTYRGEEKTQGTRYLATPTYTPCKNLRDSIFPVILDDRKMELCRCICIGICRGMLSTRGPWVVPPPLTYRGEERTQGTRYLASPTYIPCKNLRDSIFPVILDDREMELCRCICIGICRGMLSTRGPWVVPPPLTYRGEERTQGTRYLASPTYIPCKNLRDSIFPVILDDREMELCRCICIGICRGMLSTRGPWVVPPPLTYRGEERTQGTRYLASPTYIPCKNLRDSIFPVILDEREMELCRCICIGICRGMLSTRGPWVVPPPLTYRGEERTQGTPYLASPTYIPCKNLRDSIFPVILDDRDFSPIGFDVIAL